jgi:alkane 1-monooxygenase
VRFTRIGTPHWSLRNDVLNAWLLSVGLFAVLVAWFGVMVLPWLVGQAVIGFCMLETVNYLEHYGLRRQKLADGRYERVRASHSWNSNTIVANVCLFHLQRHSDHHAHPLRRYQTLCHADEAPQLPSGYATMMLIAMVPPLWRRIMDWRVIDHYDGQAHRAALSPRYAKKHGRRQPPCVGQPA